MSTDNVTTLTPQGLGNVKFRLETITPDRAKELLETNTRNRTPSKANIEKLATAIKNGQFYLTGDPIRIGEDGVLYDGQHRLLACVSADMPITSLVMRNVDERVLLAIDAGAKRSTQMQLKIKDGTPYHVTNTALMVLRMGMGSKYRNVSSETVEQIIAANPLIAGIAESYTDSLAFKIGANIPAGELVLRFHGYAEHADAWRDCWVNGHRTPLAVNAASFRNMLIDLPNKTIPAQRIWTAPKRRTQLQAVIARTMLDWTPSSDWGKSSAPFYNLITPSSLLKEHAFDVTKCISVDKSFPNWRLDVSRQRMYKRTAKQESLL